ncbi:hypothetical protein L0337_30620 [candidate division KSB1 bacterium]|nr:hypothetical protein [candidate division KSB1 bacterium]
MRYRTIKDPAVQGRITVDEVMQAVRALELERQSKSKLPKKGRRNVINRWDKAGYTEIWSKSKLPPKGLRNGSNVARKTAAKGIRAAKKA